MHVSAHIRALQSRFPALVDAKASAQRFMRRTLRTPFETDFRFLAYWRPAPGEVFIDVGANRGQSIDAMRLYHPDALIHAFEPNPHLALSLARLFEDDAALAVYRCGLAAKEETRRLFIPVYRGFVYDGLASFDEAECRSWLNAETVAGFDPSQLEVMACEAKAFPLDQLALPAGFLKLDVQGFEQAVLEGGEQTLKSAAPIVMMENNDNADAYLTGDLGWVRAAFTGKGLRANVWGALNTFYIAPAREAELREQGLWA
ncbi:MAG: FkbM family methyltransferase [Oceanicaulis sp.]